MIFDTSVIVSATERHSSAAFDAIAKYGKPSWRSFVVEGELASGVASSTKRDLLKREESLRFYRSVSERNSDLRLDELVGHFAVLTALCSKHKIKAGQSDRWMLAEALSVGTVVTTSDSEMHSLGVRYLKSEGKELVVLLDLC